MHGVMNLEKTRDCFVSDGFFKFERTFAFVEEIIETGISENGCLSVTCM
jgi:hypothetical protein